MHVYMDVHNGVYVCSVYCIEWRNKMRYDFLFLIVFSDNIKMDASGMGIRCCYFAHGLAMLLLLLLLFHWPRLLQLDVHQFVRMLPHTHIRSLYTLIALLVLLCFFFEQLLLFCNPKSGRFVLLCDYNFSSNVVWLLPSLLLWIFAIFFWFCFYLSFHLIPSIYMNKHTRNPCIRWYAGDQAIWYVHTKELQSISSHQMNIISAG